ncbi:MAG: hypothetical protein AMXMBFR13_44610 [Phycisphaerae bacterium]
MDIRSHGQRRRIAVWPMIALLFIGGCQWFIDAADREVFGLIEKRQRQALGVDREFRIDDPSADRPERVAARRQTTPYEFVPHPVDDEIPPSFRVAETRPADVAGEANAAPAPATAPAEGIAAEADLAATPPPRPQQEDLPPSAIPHTQPAEQLALAPATQSVESMIGPATQPATRELSLEEVLAYAFRHSRAYQDAKQDLYLAALDLTLERFLWTPQLVGELSAVHSSFQELTERRRGEPTLEPDRTFDAVAQVGASQRLPLGGTITAQVIDRWMRDLRDKITEGETGQTVLEANIPLLRGAGLVAMESLFQAERNLIYAIRTFEGFRRNLAVQIAGDYFNLQQLRQEIVNTEQSIAAFAEEARRAEALWRGGRRIALDVQRAEQDRLVAANRRIDALEQYQSALDAFKVLLGMPPEEQVDIMFPGEPDATGPDPSLGTLSEGLRMPSVSEDEAIDVGLKYRLDLLNDFDRIGDAQRGVRIAENNLLPDLAATSSVLMNTDPDRLGTFKYDGERTVWNVGLTLELPLNRQAERNALRRSHLVKAQVERDYEQARDLVILQVRRAMRRVIQQKNSLEIQAMNRDLALERREQFLVLLRTTGEISNRDLVEAENALLSARNRLAQAQAQLNLAILQFRRDTATLRIDEQGQWAGAPGG